MSNHIKSFAEFGPLVIFFFTYKFFGLSVATAAIIVASIISIAIIYYYEKQIPKMILFSTILLLALGSLTLFTGNMLFIKLKPTVLSLLFAAILIGASFAKKPMLKYLLVEKISLTDDAWLVFSRRWGYFFLFIAIMNEIIWRNFPEDVWVTFKVFGIISSTFIFMLSQLPFLNANKLEHDEK